MTDILKTIRAHQKAYRETGLIGVYEHVLLAEMGRAGDEIELLRADKRRMDYLEMEQRERDPGAPYSLFRRNRPITRHAIDEAMANSKTSTPGNRL